MHRSVVAILDGAIQFSDLVASCAGDVTLDLSRASIGKAARHRSRRARRERRNVVSFSREDAALSASSSEDDEDDAESMIEASYSVTESHVQEEGGGAVARRLERMSVELDAHVRFVRRGAEALASSAGEGSGAFGVLAFALEDWDR
jgi:gamma-tubulin complex component 5